MTYNIYFKTNRILTNGVSALRAGEYLYGELALSLDVLARLGGGANGHLNSTLSFESPLSIHTPESCEFSSSSITELEYLCVDGGELLPILKSRLNDGVLLQSGENRLPVLGVPILIGDSCKRPSESLEPCCTLGGVGSNPQNGT